MALTAPPRAAGELLEIDAEIQRLSKLLGTVPEELAYLGELSAADLRALRVQVTARLFDAQSGLAGLAGATRILPVALTASLAEKVFGPMLAARIASLVDVDRAVEIAQRLPVSFLADVAIELDPRRAAPILAKVSPEMVAAVTQLLVARGEWVAMGTFYGYLPASCIAAALDGTDPEALLRIALVLDDKSQLANVLDIVGLGLLDQVAAAAARTGLTEQLSALAVHLTPEQRAHLSAR